MSIMIVDDRMLGDAINVAMEISKKSRKDIVKFFKSYLLGVELTHSEYIFNGLMADNVNIYNARYGENESSEIYKFDFKTCKPFELEKYLYRYDNSDWGLYHYDKKRLIQAIKTLKCYDYQCENDGIKKVISIMNEFIVENDEDYIESNWG